MNETTGLTSVKALAQLLNDLIKEPAAYVDDAKLLLALKSQGALAAFENPQRKIVPMSLNHQKKLAMDIEGGFERIDGLRREARTVIAKCSKQSNEARKDSRAGLEARYAILRGELQVRNEDMLTLHRAYMLRCKQARLYARRAGDATLALCDREQEEMDRLLSLMRRHSGNVISLAERKGRRDGTP
ncbi:hypothetical protein [Lysobacter sp. FW306-1B-D06B]|uniref:hypothetical protein n=1 Tax=Lysobacter sp. FW306-1B-D06B TaxID=3140250 RepID=UPI00314058DC